MPETNVTHLTTFNYPTFVQVQEAIPIVTAKLRGEDVPIADLVHAGFVGLGFGLSFAFPHSPLIGQAEPNLAEMANDPAVKELVTAIPWAIILPIVLELLKKWLNR